MSKVRFFAPENRLAEAVNQPDGLLIEEVIGDADMVLTRAVGESVEKIDECLASIDGLAADAAPGRLGELYQAVREVAGLAGLAKLPDLGRAAHTFCSLIDLAQSSGALPQDQIRVNVDVLRLLRRPERFAEAERAALLDNLFGVLEKARRTAAA